MHHAPGCLTTARVFFHRHLSIIVHTLAPHHQTNVWVVVKLKKCADMNLNTAQTKTITIEFIPEVHPSDEWTAYHNPAFKLGELVKIIDESCPHQEWDEYRICALELYEPRWQNTGALMQAPEWRYGLRSPRGTGELIWFIEQEIVKSNQADLINFNTEF